MRGVITAVAHPILRLAVRVVRRAEEDGGDAEHVFDNALGAAFGAARGGLICIALITGMMAFAQDGRPPDAVLHSRIAPYLVHGGQVAAAIAPHELNQGFEKSYQAAKTAWNSAVEQASRTVNDKGKK